MLTDQQGDPQINQPPAAAHADPSSNLGAASNRGCLAQWQSGTHMMNDRRFQLPLRDMTARSTFDIAQFG